MLEEMILNSEACFKEILDYVQEEGNEQPIDEVEKGVFNQLLEFRYRAIYCNHTP